MGIASTDVGAVAGAVTEVTKVAEQLQAEKNTPDEVQGKKAREMQALRERIDAAQDALDAAVAAGKDPSEALADIRLLFTP